MYGSRKINSLRTMTLEDCHSLLLLVLLRGGKRRQTHLVHLRRDKDCAAQSSVYEMCSMKCSNVKRILTCVFTCNGSRWKTCYGAHACVMEGSMITFFLNTAGQKLTSSRKQLFH